MSESTPESLESKWESTLISRSRLQNLGVCFHYSEDSTSGFQVLVFIFETPNEVCQDFVFIAFILSFVNFGDNGLSALARLYTEGAASFGPNCLKSSIEPHS